MLVPVEALAQLKCNVCRKYLSYFPIYMSQESLIPICGRCKDFLSDTENYIQNQTYESFAQFMKFPCIYESEGCIEHLTPTNVPNHEETCPYRMTSCALDCVWQGTIRELIDHVQDVHPNALIRNGEFEIDILNPYEMHNFLTHEDEIFTVRRKFNPKDQTLECSLFCYKTLQSVIDYYYEFSVLNGSRSLSVKFPMKSANNFLEENITRIQVENVKTQLDDPSIIIGCIRILTLEHQKQALASTKPNTEINIEMLGELECPVCLEYIIPPIYQCITGHSICADCKNGIRECPSCKGEIKNTQNFTLEKMAFLLIYPCKYSELGCEFTAKPGQMKQHQKHCLFGPHFCPLADYEKCKWKGTATELHTHVNEHHHDSVLEIDDLYIFFNDGYFENQDDQCYIKYISNLMFKIHYKYSQNCFYWAVQLVGPDEEARNYKFEIDINDDHNNQKVFLRSLCAPLKDKNEAFNQPGQYVFLKREQIDSLITDQLTYTIRITK